MPSVASVDPMPIWTFALAPSCWSVITAPPSTWLPFIGWKTTATTPLVAPPDAAADADASVDASVDAPAEASAEPVVVPVLEPAVALLLLVPELHAAKTMTAALASAAGNA
jgi:hypothetical protein